MPQENDEKLTAAERKAARERAAREANAARNQERVNARDRIADNADSKRQEVEPVEDFEETEEQAPESEETDTGDESTDDTQVNDQQEETEDSEEDRDEARDSGAADSRKRADGVTEYKLVVNGKERWATLAEVRAAAQKVESADEYLQQATDSVRRTVTEGTDDESEESDRMAAAERKARIERYADLQRRAAVGDEEAIAELAQHLEGLSRVTPDVLQAVDERVDQRVRGRETFQQAVSWFEGEYAEELKFPKLKAQAARLDKEYAAANPGMTPRDRLQKVGNELRELVKELGVPVGKTPKVDKLARKQEAPRGVSASGRHRPETDDEADESVQQQIDRIAKARGQARAIQHK